jgi:hypothetical protein
LYSRNTDEEFSRKLSAYATHNPLRTFSKRNGLRGYAVDIEVENQKARLTRAELLIEKLEKQVAEQEKRIEEQRANGHHVGPSERFVQNFVEILSAWRYYRIEVLSRLEMLGRPG